MENLHPDDRTTIQKIHDKMDRAWVESAFTERDFRLLCEKIQWVLDGGNMTPSWTCAYQQMQDAAKTLHQLMNKTYINS